MKCTLNVVVFPVVSFILSIGSLAVDHRGISSDQIKNVPMQSGNGNPSTILREESLEHYDLSQHKKAFAGTLAKIVLQSKKFEEPAMKISRFVYLKTLLPQEFHVLPILALAQAVGFSHADDNETRFKKYISLALLLKDIYDPDNIVSRNLGLLSPSDIRKLSQQEIIFFITLSLDQAIELAEHIMPTIPRERAIDFHLSVAQVLVWRLNYGRQSLIHMLGDFAIDGPLLTIDANSKKIKEAIFAELALAEELIKNPSVEVPVIYHNIVNKLVKSLSQEQKFTIIQMHKADVDAARSTEINTFDELQRVRGLEDDEKNPLDYFTVDKIAELKQFAQEQGLDEERFPTFLYNYMRGYAMKRVVVEKYFTQDILQRYLLKMGVIHRNVLERILLDKIERIAQATHRVSLSNNVVYLDS